MRRPRKEDRVWHRRAYAQHAQAPRRWTSFLVWKVETDQSDPDDSVRFWVPAFDVLMIVAGLIAVIFGSPILHRLFPVALVDVAGIGMTLAATLALVGVVFPRLVLLELIGKLLIVFFLGAYTACVALFPSDPTASNAFLVTLLVAMIFLICPHVKRVYRKPAVQAAVRRALHRIRRVTARFRRVVKRRPA